jgi:hypothetical protein
MSAPTSWDVFPLILHVPEMAALLQCSADTIRKRCAKRKMHPPPHSSQRPYIWYREAVRATFEQRIPAPPRTRGVIARTHTPRTASASEVRSAREALTRDLTRPE